VKRRKISNHEIESQTAKDPQNQRETRRRVPVWQLVCVRVRTLQLLLLRLQEVGLPPRNAVAALANVGAASTKRVSISYDQPSQKPMLRRAEMDLSSFSMQPPGKDQSWNI